MLIFILLNNPDKSIIGSKIAKTVSNIVNKSERLE